VIGVGGGGSNAVTHMYRQGIRGVDFIICNTDAQAMESSPVPTKIQLGANLTGGLGAGAVPSIGKNSALENVQDIRAILEKGTKMLFITAGLGGGTGTGAAPVIASVSRELGILTVGIVTLPFSFEGRKRKQHAEQGIAELKKYVDALLIICNDKLRLLFGDQRLSAAFAHADDVLTNAAKGIAEIITVTGYINVDFEDVKTVMKDSGVAIMGTGMASGEDRALNAIEMALNSPLLNDNNIEGANNLLLYIASGKEEITMDEVTEITDYIQEMTKNSAEVIWGNGIDESLEDRISVTIIATGFDEEHRKKAPQPDKPVTVKKLYEDHAPVSSFTESVRTPEENIVEPAKEREEILLEPAVADQAEEDAVPLDEDRSPDRTIVFDFETQDTNSNDRPFLKTMPVDESPSMKTPVEAGPKVLFKPVTSEIQTQKPSAGEPAIGVDRLHNQRVQRLKELSEKLKIHPAPIEDHLTEIENVPAYQRRNVDLADVQHSSESLTPKYTLTENPDKSVDLTPKNSFLHNNVD
jgi:cell division protein FtsZ